jgi:hypothetical protein
MNIENFKLIDFFNQPSELIAEYMTVMKFLKASKTRKQVFNMKLKKVEFIKRCLNSGIDRDLIKMISKIEKISEEAVLEMPIIDFFGLVRSVKDQVELISRAEENGLSSSTIDVKWLAVNGSERMAKFGIYNTLDKLTGKKPHLYKKYMNMIYSEVFTILLKWKEEEDLIKEMDAIKTKKDV